jgi:hypothetical protein
VAIYLILETFARLALAITGTRSVEMRSAGTPSPAQAAHHRRAYPRLALVQVLPEFRRRGVPVMNAGSGKFPLCRVDVGNGAEPN